MMTVNIRSPLERSYRAAYFSRKSPDQTAERKPWQLYRSFFYRCLEKYVLKNPLTEYVDLVNDYSYAPEIQKFIRKIFGCLQKAFEKETENG